MRLDKYLKVSRVIKRRTVANEVCDAKHVTVNGKLCDVPSAIVRPGDVVAIREKDRNMIAVLDSLKRNSGAQVGWLSLEEATMQGTLLSVPERAEIPENLEMQLIVELYSR
jgi:small subunit ribosomal protein S4